MSRLCGSRAERGWGSCLRLLCTAGPRCSPVHPSGPGPRQGTGPELTAGVSDLQEPSFKYRDACHQGNAQSQRKGEQASEHAGGFGGARLCISGWAPSSGFSAGPSQARASGANFPGECQGHEVQSPQADGRGENDPGDRAGGGRSNRSRAQRASRPAGGRARSGANTWAPSV